MENYIFLFQNIFFLNCMKLFECIRNSVFFISFFDFLCFSSFFIEKQCFPKCKKNELAHTWPVRITWKLEKKQLTNPIRNSFGKTAALQKPVFLQSKKHLLVFFVLQCNLEITLRNHKHKYTNINAPPNTKNCQNLHKNTTNAPTVFY